MPAPSPGVAGRLRAAGCVFAEDEAAILVASAQSPDELDCMVAARVRGLPLEQVVGWAGFRGLRVLLDRGVFVPRRRSEFLVETALALAFPPGAAGITPATSHAPPAREGENAQAAPSGKTDIPGISPAGGPVIVDVCCGTGALGLAVAAALKGSGRGDAELHAVDLDPAAVACARRNVEPAGGRVYQGDLFAPLPDSLLGRVDILICNAPYVPTGELAFMPPEARDHEARIALDGGDDGLAVLRRVQAQAPRWLALGGVLLVEASERQADAMAGAMTCAGLLAEVHYDEAAGATVVTGTAPAAPPRGR
jgi:release factor glutamine methyltransferase